MDNLIEDNLIGDSQVKLVDMVGLGRAVALSVMDILKVQHHNLVGACHTAVEELKDSTEVVEAGHTSFKATSGANPFPSHILVEQLHQAARGSSLAIGEERHTEVMVSSTVMAQILAAYRELVVEHIAFAIVVPILA